MMTVMMMMMIGLWWKLPPPSTQSSTSTSIPLFTFPEGWWLCWWWGWWGSWLWWHKRQKPYFFKAWFWYCCWCFGKKSSFIIETRLTSTKFHLDQIQIFRYHGQFEVKRVNIICATIKAGFWEIIQYAPSELKLNEDDHMMMMIIIIMIIVKIYF